MRRPVTVYLDTSDYSGLAEVGFTAKGEKYKDSLAALLRLRDSGKVVFRYSLVHLMEFLKSESSTIETSVRKAEVMTRLSGTKVFRCPWEVWDREFSLLLGDLDEECVAISDEGEWYPTNIQLGDGDDLDYMWREMEAIAPGLMENGRPKMEFIRAVREDFDEGFLQQQVPVANDFNSKEFVLSMLMGRLRPGEVIKKAMAGFAEPNLFISHYFKEMPDAKALFRQFGQLEEKLYAQIQSMQGFVRSLGEVGDERIRGEMKKYLLKDSRWPYLGKGAEDPGTTAKIAQGNAHPVLKSISAHIMIFNSYFAHNFTPNASLRQAKLSDVGDLLHATYLPYADIFRTDGYFGDLIRKHGEKFGAQVVSSFDKLIPAIEKAADGVVSQQEARLS
jgi:hypothetical protein